MRDELVPILQDWAADVNDPVAGQPDRCQQSVELLQSVTSHDLEGVREHLHAALAAARQAAPQDRTVVVAGPVEELYRLLRHQRK